jgi:L-alanine-DL-glutamate epimerase-like enolase superfamily enzyme
MRVTGIELYVCEFPLKSPFRIAYADWTAMPSIVSRIITDEGIEGLGEGVPDPEVTGETLEATVAVLTHDLGPMLLGRDPRDMEAALLAFRRRVRGVPTAVATLEIAMNDLIGKAYGIPAHRLYGGRTTADLDLFHVVSLGSPDEMAESSAKAIAGGYRGLKLKLGGGTELDEVARVSAVRQAVGDDVPVKIDANQGWGTPGRAIRIIRKLERFAPVWVEQPVAQWNLEGLAEVRSKVDVPIMADEAVHDARDLMSIIRLKAADLINIKLMKCGGMSQAMQLIHIAAGAGLAVQIGSMVESGIASMAGAHLAAAREEVVSLETSGPLLFSADGVESPIRAPRFQVADAPGLGVRLTGEFQAMVRRRVAIGDVV